MLYCISIIELSRYAKSKTYFVTTILLNNLFDGLFDEGKVSSLVDLDDTYTERTYLASNGKSGSYITFGLPIIYNKNSIYDI